MRVEVNRKCYPNIVYSKQIAQGGTYRVEHCWREWVTNTNFGLVTWTNLRVNSARTRLFIWNSNRSLYLLPKVSYSYFSFRWNSNCVCVKTQISNCLFQTGAVLCMGGGVKWIYGSVFCCPVLCLASASVCPVDGRLNLF